MECQAPWGRAGARGRAAKRAIPESVENAGNAEKEGLSALRVRMVCRAHRDNRVHKASREAGECVARRVKREIKERWDLGESVVNVVTRAKTEPRGCRGPPEKQENPGVQARWGRAGRVVLRAERAIKATMAIKERWVLRANAESVVSVGTRAKTEPRGHRGLPGRRENPGAQAPWGRAGRVVSRAKMAIKATTAKLVDEANAATGARMESVANAESAGRRVSLARGVIAAVNAALLAPLAPLVPLVLLAPLVLLVPLAPLAPPESANAPA